MLITEVIILKSLSIRVLINVLHRSQLQLISFSPSRCETISVLILGRRILFFCYAIRPLNLVLLLCNYLKKNAFIHRYLFTRLVPCVVSFSQHDTTVAAFTSALNVYNNILPPYATAVLVELVKSDDEYFVQILYKNVSSHEPYNLTVPG